MAASVRKADSSSCTTTSNLSTWNVHRRSRYGTNIL